MALRQAHLGRQVRGTKVAKAAAREKDQEKALASMPIQGRGLHKVAAKEDKRTKVAKEAARAVAP